MNYSTRKMIITTPLVLLLAVGASAFTSIASSSSVGSSSSSSSSAGKSSSDLGSSESRSYGSHSNLAGGQGGVSSSSASLSSPSSSSSTGESNSGASTAALYSLSKAMASALAATRYHSNDHTSAGSSSIASSPSISSSSSVSSGEESPEEYIPKRKTVILAIPVKLALQQAAAAAAVDAQQQQQQQHRQQTASSLAHLPSSHLSSGPYGEEPRHQSMYTSSSSSDAAPQVNAYSSGAPSSIQSTPQIVTYQAAPVQPSPYQQQPQTSVLSVPVSPAPVIRQPPVTYAAIPSSAPAPIAYTGSSSSGHTADRPTYTDKSPKSSSYSNENEVDDSYVESSGNSYSGNAQSYESSQPMRLRGHSSASSSVDSSDYESDSESVTSAPVKKSKKSRPVYYLEESAESDDTYVPVSKVIKEKASSASLLSSSQGDALEGIDFGDAFATATGLRSAAASTSGLTTDDDYASALTGASASALLASSSLYPQSDLSSFILKSQRQAYSPITAASSPYSLAAGYATGHRGPSTYGYPRSASALRPLYAASTSPYSTSSPYFKPTYPGSGFAASAASKIYLPSASSPFKAYFSPASTLPFATGASSFASSALPSSSSPSASSSAFSSLAPLRIGGSNGISVGKAIGGKGVRIGPLEFSAAGSSLFPTIKIKAPSRSL